MTDCVIGIGDAHTTRKSLLYTYAFVECLKNLNLVRKQVVSFDAISLFADLTISRTMDYLFAIILQNTIIMCLPVKELRQPLPTCAPNVQFEFNGKFTVRKMATATRPPVGRPPGVVFR